MSINKMLHTSRRKGVVKEVYILKKPVTDGKNKYKGPHTPTNK